VAIYESTTNECAAVARIRAREAEKAAELRAKP
jgi:hypothetical protein